MVKHFCILTAFVEVQIKRQEKSVRKDKIERCFQVFRMLLSKIFVSEKQGQAAIVDQVLVSKNVLEITNNTFQHSSAL